MPARRATGTLPHDFAVAKRYWLNVHQLCDGDLTYLERKQAEQRLIEELDAA